ncbi:MAG: glycosyltransferase family 2 protein [Planctomycetaceae bacterium]|nr:glycosyltransferase family 2 protein [Planctomycetaceae bacterium]
MTSTPRISVIVPSYNHRRFLPERIDTILNQTRQDFELILLDDASQDGSAEYLQEVSERSGARFIPNLQNTGSPFAQWNRGLSAAKGEFVWIAESDDVADPGFLEALVRILESDDNIGIVFCRSRRIDENGQCVPETPSSMDDELRHDFRIVRCDAVRTHLYTGNTIVSASAVVFRRRIYNAAGPADASFRLSGDWLQWSRMLLISDLSYIAEPLSGTRIHTNTRRHSTSTSGTLELESLAVQKYIRGQLQIDRQQVRMGAQRMSLSWLQAMRAGRFSGNLMRHPLFFYRLFCTDAATGLIFALNWPYAFLVWIVKRFCPAFRPSDP